MFKSVVQRALCGLLSLGLALSARTGTSCTSGQDCNPAARVQTAVHDLKSQLKTVVRLSLVKFEAGFGAITGLGGSCGSCAGGGSDDGGNGSSNTGLVARVTAVVSSSPLHVNSSARANAGTDSGKSSTADADVDLSVKVRNFLSDCDSLLAGALVDP